MHLPGFGPKRARRLYDELGIDSLEALRARGRAARSCAGCAASAPRPRRTCCECSPTGRRRRAGRRACCSRARCRSPSRSSTRCAPHPAADRVEVAGSLRRLADSVKDLDVIATADDPRGARARRWPSCRSSSRSAQSGRRRRARDDPRRAEGRPEGRRAGPVRQRAAALHRLQGAQRGAARGGRAARPARLRVRHPRRRDGRDAALRDRGGGLRGARAGRGSRPSCARAAASSRRRAGRRRCRSWSTLEDLRGDLHCHTTLSDGRQDRRGDGRRRRASAATSTSRSPTTRPSHGFGDHVDAGRAARADRARARAQRRARRTSSC